MNATLCVLPRCSCRSISWTPASLTMASPLCMLTGTAGWAARSGLALILLAPWDQLCDGGRCCQLSLWHHELTQSPHALIRILGDFNHAFLSAMLSTLKEYVENTSQQAAKWVNGQQENSIEIVQIRNRWNKEKLMNAYSHKIRSKKMAPKPVYLKPRHDSINLPKPKPNGAGGPFPVCHCGLFHRKGSTWQRIYIIIWCI